MPHITAQCLLAGTTQTGHGHAAGQGKNRKNERLNIPGMHLDIHGLSVKSLQAISDASSSLSRSPHTQKLNGFPTPTPTSTSTTTTSATFDSPQKSSPSSSISSNNPLEIERRANTPIAELEDTSLASICPELEDTSNHAIHSRSRRSLSSYTVKSTHPTVSYILNLFFCR